MTILFALVALVVGLVIGFAVPRRGRSGAAPARNRKPGAGGPRQILLPFTPNTLSKRALEAAIRLARAEQATLMPAFLATVPLTLALDSPLPRQSEVGMPLLEAIEQRVCADGIACDCRVQAGRTYRHALERLLEHEQFERVIISATETLQTGLSGPDLVWLLTHTNAEVMILRPASEDTRVVSAGSVSSASKDRPRSGLGAL